MENVTYFVSSHLTKQLNRNIFLWEFDVQVEQEFIGGEDEPNYLKVNQIPVVATLIYEYNQYVQTMGNTVYKTKHNDPLNLASSQISTFSGRE